MSQLEYCRTKGYNKFMVLKKELKDVLINNFRLIITDYIGNSATYFGISVYKKVEFKNYYDVLYSTSIYTNENGKYTINENDFSGFVFDKISEIDSSGNKSHKYLKIFFKDIHEVLTSKNDNLYYIKTKKIENNFIVQFYLTFSKNKITKVLEEKIKGLLNNVIIDNKKTLDCIQYSDIKMILKKGITKLEDQVILIIDLVRLKERIQQKYVDMDSVLTSKLIYELKDIAGGLNFKTINHTGDGFVFIYRGEKENLSNDIKLLIERSYDKMKDFKDFLNDLNNVGSSYKVRAIISNCPTLYEMDYINSIDKKLYFSSYLDMIFEDMFMLKDYEDKCMLYADIFFLIRNNILKNDNSIDEQDYITCNIEQNNNNLYIIGVKR